VVHCPWRLTNHEPRTTHHEPRPEATAEVLDKLLSRSFYIRDAVTVARALLGKIVRHGETSGRIVETEAYLGTGDEAAHSAAGITPRTQVIFGPPGHAYVYLSYGIHSCLNIVAEPEGSAGCVLIRALDPLTGVDEMRIRRGVRDLANLANGPGKLTKALGITLAHNGVDVTRGPIQVLDDGYAVKEIEVSRRIGISKSQDLPLRFCVGRE
jgi:DNA-3-methyladenine glycosylase